MKQLLFLVSLIVMAAVIFSPGYTDQSNGSDANFQAIAQTLDLEPNDSDDNDDRWSDYDRYQRHIADVNGNDQNVFAHFASMETAVSKSKSLAPDSLTNGGFEICNDIKATCTRDEEVFPGWTIISKDGCTNGSYGLVQPSMDGQAPPVELGNYSLRIIDKSAENYWGVQSEYLPAQAGESWSASVYARAPKGGADLYIEFWDPTKSDYLGGGLLGSHSGDQWTSIGGTMFAPSGTGWVSILLYSSTAAITEAYFDNAQLTLTGATPIDYASYACVYGAQANDTGNPIGGGDGYKHPTSDILPPCNPEILAHGNTQFLPLVQNENVMSTGSLSGASDQQKNQSQRFASQAHLITAESAMCEPESPFYKVVETEEQLCSALCAGECTRPLDPQGIPLQENLYCATPATGPFTVYIKDDAVIDWSKAFEAGTQIVIGEDVTLASGRGHDGRRGAIISSISCPETNAGLIKLVGTNARVTGLRIKGPGTNEDPKGPEYLCKAIVQYSQECFDEDYSNPSCMSEEPVLAEVDNSELTDWPIAIESLVTGRSRGLPFQPGQLHFHHNQVSSPTYGVSLMFSDAQITGNLFNGFNDDSLQHAVTLDGFPGTSYDARYNVVLSNATTAFDVHGGIDKNMVDNVGGDRFVVAYNTTLYPAGNDNPLKGNQLSENRGTPTVGHWVFRNEERITRTVDHEGVLQDNRVDDNYDPFKNESFPTINSCIDAGSYWCMKSFEDDASNDLKGLKTVCSGPTETSPPEPCIETIISEQVWPGSQEYGEYSWTEATCEYGNPVTIKLTDCRPEGHDQHFDFLRVSAFDNRHGVDYDVWYISYGSYEPDSASDFSSWEFRNLAKPGQTVSRVLHGDLNGDNREDLLRASGNVWEASLYGNTTWKSVGGSGHDFAAMRLVDINDDGFADIFRVGGAHNTFWVVSYGENDSQGKWTGMGDWQDLPELVGSRVCPGGRCPTIDELTFGNFDSDSRVEVFYAVDGGWFYFDLDTGTWNSIGGSQFGLEKIRLGDFDGSGITDLLRINDGNLEVSYDAKTLWTPLTSAQGPLLTDYAFADFDNDGKLDILYSNGTETQIYQSAEGGWQQLPGVLPRVKHLIVADFSGDGIADVLSVQNP